MNRRPSVAAAACAALAAVTVPSHAAPRATPCVTIVDPAGDAAAPSAALVRPPATGRLDITGASFRTDDDRLVGTVTVADMTKPPVGTSTRFEWTFVLRELEMTVFYNVGEAREVDGRVLQYQEGIVVHGEHVSSKVKGSVSGNTVTVEVRHADLADARGRDITGHRLTRLRTGASALYGIQSQPFDSAAAPPAAAVSLAGACRR